MAKHGGIKDSGEYFVITPTSRKVTVPHIHKSIGTVGDHNSEQITFECPKIVDGHDVSQCANRYVTWVNVLGDVGHDELKVAQVEQGTEDTIYLSWTIRNALTAEKGIVQFSVHFEDTDENGATLYRWSTTTCKDCEILESINAVLGTYEAIYVAGDTLVISDYTPVKDGALKLDTNALIPEGELAITNNGTYDVGKYAIAEVKVVDDPNLIPENIKQGVSIFGVKGSLVVPQAPSGTYPVIIKSNGDYNVAGWAKVQVRVPSGKIVRGKLVNDTSGISTIYYTSLDEEGMLINSSFASIGEDYEFSCVENSIVTVQISSSANEGRYLDTSSTRNIRSIYSVEDVNLFVFCPTGDDFVIRIHKGHG